MKITFNKSITIENTRLALFSYGLMFTMLIFFFGFMYLTNGFFNAYRVNGSAFIYAEFSEEFATVSSEDAAGFCTDVSKYAFTFSKEYSYDGFHCVNLPQTEMRQKQGMNKFFFPTYFHDDYTIILRQNPIGGKAIRKNGCAAASNTWAQSHKISLDPFSNVPQCTGDPRPICYRELPYPGRKDYVQCLVSARRHYLTIGIGALQINFKQSFQVLGEMGKIYLPMMSSVDEDDNLLSIIFTDKAGGGNEEFDCNQPEKGKCRFSVAMGNPYVTLTYEQWLKAADLDLDRRNENVGEDIENGQYPYVRLTGARINVEIIYESPALNDYQKGPLAMIKVSGRKEWTSVINSETWYDHSNWSDTPTNLATENITTKERYYHGLLFEVKNNQAHTWLVLSIKSILFTFAALGVFKKYLDMVVYYFSLYCLGNTSRTYIRACIENLDVSDACKRTVPSRLMIAAISFFNICSLEQELQSATISRMTDPSFSKTISYDTIYWIFERIMNLQENIDRAELKNMCDMIFSRLSTGEGEGKGRVSIDSFVRAIASMEYFDLDAMVRTFDSDRKRSLLEMIFSDTTDRRAAYLRGDVNYSSTRPVIASEEWEWHDKEVPERYPQQQSTTSHDESVDELPRKSVNSIRIHPDAYRSVTESTEGRRVSGGLTEVPTRGPKPYEREVSI